MSDTPLADALRQQIGDALNAIPDGKRGALLIVADEHGTKAHLAARLGEHWTVAGGGGWEWSSKKPSGFVGVEASW